MTYLEKKRERDRAYYLAHKEKRKAYQREYYKKNKEKYDGYKSNPVSVGAVKAVFAMEECVRKLSEVVWCVKSEDMVVVVRRCIDDLADVCIKLKNQETR